MAGAVTRDDVVDAVDAGPRSSRHRRTTVVEQMWMERPVHDFVAVEVDLQDTRLAGDTRPVVPHEVAERERHKPPIVEHDRLQHVWVLADDHIGAVVQQLEGEIALAALRTGHALAAPMDDGNHHVCLACGHSHVAEHSVPLVRRRNPRTRLGRRKPERHNH